MKPKYLLTVALIVGVTSLGFAQYSQDALRYSTFQTGSTSRIKAVGNAGTAIGGDLSNVGGNPAGLGFFTRSEFSFTPEFDGSKVNSAYFGQNASSSKSTLNLNNAAVVFYSKLNTPKGTDKNKGWLSINFGIGYNRTNNYYENIQYGGTNTKNSITDYYANDANINSSLNTSTGVRTTFANSLGDWAFNQNLIDQYSSSNNLFQSNATHTAINPSGFSQGSNAIRSGGESELNLSMGANYSNQFYLGFGIGITNLRYNTTNSFTEKGIASVFINSTTNANETYNNVYSQDQETKGSGFNAKIGFIYKPVEAIRFGAVITSPTWYNIDDNYNESMSTNLNGNNLIKNGPVNYPFTYNLQTPLKVAGGLAIFIKQYGFITGDVEYLDYSTAKINTTYSGQSADNNDIRTLYQSAVNAHAGAEIRVTPNFFLRGGYGVQGNPMVNNGSNINTTSGGIGFRNSQFYLDITYSHIAGSQTVYAYELTSNSPSALLNKTNDNVYATIGFRF